MHELRSHVLQNLMGIKIALVPPVSCSQTGFKIHLSSAADAINVCTFGAIKYFPKVSFHVEFL